MEIINYSPTFGYRKHRAYYILEDYCNKYYNERFYLKLTDIIDKLTENTQHSIDKKTECHDDIEEVRLDTCFENSVNEILDCIKYPNKKFNFPDHMIKDDEFGDVWIDTKSVLCTKNNNGTYETKYNNSGGQINSVTEHILNHWSEKNDLYYKSFIIFIYYAIEDNKVIVLDVMIAPTIYTLYLRKYDWNDLSTIKFATKSKTNLQIPIGLPSFTSKTGMKSLEEQELALATATYNYIEKHPTEFKNDRFN